MLISCRSVQALLPFIVPYSNNSINEELLTNVNSATLNKKFVAVTTCYRHARKFKYAAPLNVYLAKQYLTSIDQVKTQPPSFKAF